MAEIPLTSPMAQGRESFQFLPANISPLCLMSLHLMLYFDTYPDAPGDSRSEAQVWIGAAEGAGAV